MQPVKPKLVYTTFPVAQLFTALHSGLDWYVTSELLELLLPHYSTQHLHIHSLIKSECLAVYI